MSDKKEKIEFDDVLGKLMEGQESKHPDGISSTSDDVYCYPYQEISMDKIDKCKYDVDAFQRGIDSMSELAGKITALSNIGVSPESALEYIASIQAAEYTFNLQSKLSEESNSTNLKIAELNGENMMKQVF